MGVFAPDKRSPHPPLGGDEIPQACSMPCRAPVNNRGRITPPGGTPVSGGCPISAST
jgi:hypothetical protein